MSYAALEEEFQEEEYKDENTFHLFDTVLKDLDTLKYNVALTADQFNQMRQAALTTCKTICSGSTNIYMIVQAHNIEEELTKLENWRLKEQPKPPEVKPLPYPDLKWPKLKSSRVPS